MLLEWFAWKAKAMYSIKVEYETGDSFHTEDTECILDATWSDPDIAKQNLVRIQEHYDWSERGGEKPDFCKGKDAKYYFPILLDDGTEKEICASWCGYFETLYGATIISSPEDGWSFRL
tara:strand:+ start:3341 stop:3697 length:357 start_codon:yes stop_codon:yes gene_type:complete